MFWNFSVLFPKPKSSAQHEEDLQRLQRDLVQRLSRGNVCLQHGKFLTARDAEHIKHQSLQFKF
jgi:hypothetical protein